MELQKLLKAQWDRTGAVAFSAVGALALLIGWIGVSGTAYVAAQIPYVISGGIGGVFFLGLGATLWISADLRDEWRKLDRIEAAISDGTLRWADGELPSAPADLHERIASNGHVPSATPLATAAYASDTIEMRPIVAVAEKPARAPRATAPKPTARTASTRSSAARSSATRASATRSSTTRTTTTARTTRTPRSATPRRDAS